MRTVAAMDVRRHFGSILDEVRLKSERIIIARDGRPVAMISPVESIGDVPGVRAGRIGALNRLCDFAGVTPSGPTADTWLRRERDGWSERPA
jgi:prevent-host-death family protein